MVKPLNKEWEFFGKKYRVDGAKGEKVDCNACHKQVSAAVNRLQSHLRICPARTQLQLTLPTPTTSAIGSASISDLEDPHLTSQSHSGAMNETGNLEKTDGVLMRQIGRPNVAVTVPTAPSTASGANSAASGVNGGGLVAVGSASKRLKTSPSKHRARVSWSLPGDEFSEAVLNGGATTSTTCLSTSSVALAKRQLEIEEKRLELEKQRNQREEKRDLYELIILKAQAEKERWQAEKERYEARVALALARKQLRDQGVSDEEINLILPIASLDTAKPSALTPTTANSVVDATSSSNVESPTPTLPCATSPASALASASASAATLASCATAPASTAVYSALSCEEIKSSVTTATSTEI